MERRRSRGAVSCNLAWVSYLNSGSLGDPSKVEPMQWLESAVLVYRDGRWRVRFLHSTRKSPPG